MPAWRSRLTAMPWWAWLGVPLVAWLASRAFVTVLGVIASLSFGRAEIGLDQAVPQALNLFGSWDTTWYLDIARRGYAFDVGQVGQVFTNVAFFPLVPMIMAAALALGLNPFWVAIIASNGMFLVALVALYNLTKGRFGPVMAMRATWVLALAPPAVAASMAYTEGLALGLAALAGYLAWKGHFGWAGSVAAIAVLTRPTGVLAVVPVLMLAFYAGDEGRRARLVKAVAPAAVVMVAFLGYMQFRQGGWSLPLQAQAAWGRGQLGVGLLSLLPADVGQALGGLFGGDLIGSRDLLGKETIAELSGLSVGDWSAVVRDVLFGIIYVFLLARLWRSEGGLRSPWVLYAFLVLVVPLSSGSVTSLARLGLLAYPLAWPMAAWLGEGGPARRRWTLVAALVITALMVAQLAGQSP
ncbi:MAG: hypothetical protein O3B97_01120 [Actinomycetota bacterium]|nr:hypothetical protein [Actinomycetota bacterium]